MLFDGLRFGLGCRARVRDPGRNAGTIGNELAFDDDAAAFDDDAGCPITGAVCTIEFIIGMFCTVDAVPCG